MGFFVKGVGIFYRSEIKSIPKNGDELHPIYEAFTNAWESFVNVAENEKYIKIILCHKSLLDESHEFEKFIIEDNGVGLNEENFDRLCTLRQDSKNPKNKGTGRIQYLHFFETTKMESVYDTEEGTFYREVELSKSELYLNQNAFIRTDKPQKTEKPRCTRVIFSGPKEDKDRKKYNELNIEILKRELIAHYMSLLCSHKESLPQIELHYFVDDVEKDFLKIESVDIPNVDYSRDFSVHYKKVEDGKIIQSSKTEDFKIESFKVSSESQKYNQFFFLSKGEIAGNALETLIPKKTSYDGYRYIFMLSGDYLDSHDTDSRGMICMTTESELKKKQKEECFFDDEYVTIEDLTYQVKHEINSHYNVFKEKQLECENHVKQLEDTFLLNKDVVEKVLPNISQEDSDEKILEKIYKAESEVVASQDAKLVEQQKELEQLDPTADDYSTKLQSITENLVKNMPLRNRVELSKYVAHRKIVLDAFEKILNAEKAVTKKEDHINENVLHNLIFKQHTNDPSNSDLWLVNEEYVYFKGISEAILDNVEIDGEKIFKETLTEEEEEYKLSCKENGGLKRPDILLFPSEGKCLIIELKAPNVNVSEHLNQINQYATLIHNLTKDKFCFDNFYGYLIGENIDPNNVRRFDTDFKFAPHSDFLYRPNKEIDGLFKPRPGWLYTEIMKYSTLLERAKLRNKAFIDKLMK